MVQSKKPIYFILIFVLLLSFCYFPVVVGEETCQTCKSEGCERCVWDGSDEYCIFHDPDPNKNRDIFLDEFKIFLNEQKEKEAATYDLSGFVFPTNITTTFPSPQHSYHFDKKVYFKNTVFWSYTCFRDITFEAGADFSGATFKAGAEFTNVDFNGTADFNDVRFEGKTYFLNVTFKGDVRFEKGSQEKGTIFEGKTQFQGVTFENNVSFEDAVFEDTLWFSSGTDVNGTEINTTFGKEEKKLGTKGIEIGIKTGRGGPLYERRRTASFIRTEFHGPTYFNECIFNVEANFSSAHFKETAEFIVGEFKKHTTFSKAIFENDVDFVRMTFGSEIHFPEVKFNGDTRFFYTYFNSGVNFDSSRFRGDLELKTGRLDKNLSLPNVRVEKALILEIEEKDAKFINLRTLKVYGYGIVTANLKKTSFGGAFLKNINFINCTWPEDYTVYEENNKENLNLNFTDLEFVYRNLKNSFQNYGDNEMASHFFYREMEMKKKRISFKDNLGEWILLRMLWPCGYGERFWRLLVCSFGIITIFAILFLASGIDIKNRRKYNLSLSDWIKYFYYSCVFSISSFTTLGSNYITPRNKKSKFLSVFESLIGAFFIALFIYVFARKMLR